MEGKEKREGKPEGELPQGREAVRWPVPDEEIDRVIRMLEEGWGA